MLGKKKQRSLRYLVVNKSLAAVMSSLLLRVICIYIFSGILISLKASKVWIALTVLTSTVLSLRYSKLLIFEALLASHVIAGLFGYFDWYNEVDDGLYLGAIPLMEHRDMLVKDLGVDAVLSVVEDFELNCSTAIGRTISKEEYTRMGIAHKQIVCRDFLAPSLRDLDDGATYLNNLLSEGKKVYCHCKSGRGRSACVVMAYLLKFKYHGNLTAAHEDMVRKRPLVFKKGSIQMRRLALFVEGLKTYDQR